MKSVVLLAALSAALPAYAETDTQSLEYYRAYPLADKGYKLIREHRYERATELFERAVKVAPNNMEYRAQLVDLLVRKKDYELAARIAADGLAIAPNHQGLQARQKVVADLTAPAPEPVVVAEVVETPAATKPVVKTARPVVAAKPAPTILPQSAVGYYDQALQLQRSGKEREAIPLLEEAYALEPTNDVYAVSLGYAYRNHGYDEKAVPLFQQSLKAKPNAMVQEDMAWSMKEIGMREESAEALKGVLPTVEDKDKHYGLRREIQQLEDNWTSIGSITYRDGLARSSGIPGIQNTEESLQYGFETVYSPDSMQRHGRRLLQFYGQLFASSNEGEYDFNDETTQGAVGVRTMPIPNVEWYLYAARLFRVGSNAINDWQLRTTYSYTDGFDIDPNRDSWSYLFLTPDISYLVDRQELFASFEGRYGRSYRFNDWVLTPHIVGAAAHNQNDFDNRDSIEYGPGLSVKYWFDESEYRAATGSAELILQWREAAGPSEDESGPFIRLVLQY